jgi:hypothetical protein
VLHQAASGITQLCNTYYDDYEVQSVLARGWHTAFREGCQHFKVRERLMRAVGTLVLGAHVGGSHVVVHPGCLRASVLPNPATFLRTALRPCRLLTCRLHCCSLHIAHAALRRRDWAH